MTSRGTSTSGNLAFVAGPFLLVAFFSAWAVAADPILQFADIQLDDDSRRLLGYVIGVGFWLSIARAADRLLVAIVWRKVELDSTRRAAPRLLVDLVRLALYGLALAMILGTVFHQPLTGFWATSGVLGLVLGFALRNLILDLFTGIAVNVEQPYRMDDWLEVHLPAGPQVGRVIQMNWRTTRLATESGDVVLIPNGVLAELAVIHRGGFQRRMRGEVSVRIDFDAPVERVRRVLTAALIQAADRPGFVADAPPRVLVAGVTAGGVEYLLRYWTTVWGDLSPTAAADIVLSSALEHLRQAGFAPAHEKEDVFIHNLPPSQLDSRSDEDRAELLSRVEIFRSLDAGNLAALAAAIRRVSLKAGSRMIEAGASGESMFLVVEGVLDVLVPVSRGGTLRKVSRIGPGEVLGEMCLLTGEPRSATIEAVTDVIAYEITREPVTTLFRCRPEVAERISEIVAQRLAARTLALAANDDSLAAAPEITAGQLLGRIKAVFRSAWR